VIEKPKEKTPPKDLLKELEEMEQKDALKQLQAELAGESNQPKKVMHPRVKLIYTRLQLCEKFKRM